MLYVQHNVLLAIKPLFKLCGPRSMLEVRVRVRSIYFYKQRFAYAIICRPGKLKFYFFWKQISHIRSLGLPMMANTGSPPLTQFLKTLGNRVSRKLRCYSVMIKVAWFSSSRLRPHVFANQNNFLYFVTSKPNTKHS